MGTITNADIQRYVRVALQWLAAYLTTRGMIDPNASWVQPVMGALVGMATFAWTIYGNRIQAKINEFIELGQDPKATKDTKVQLTNAVAAMPETKEVISDLGSHPDTLPNVVIAK